MTKSGPLDFPGFEPIQMKIACPSLKKPASLVGGDVMLDRWPTFGRISRAPVPVVGGERIRGAPGGARQRGAPAPPPSARADAAGA